MKIVQILLSPRIGGAETLAAALAEEWEKTGNSSHIVYLDDSHDGGSKVARLRVLRRRLRMLEPDIVLSHSALPNVYARLAAPRGTPVVTVLHSATDDFSNRSLRIAELFLRFRTSWVVAVSAKQRESYTKHFGTKINMTVIPNGTRTEGGLKTSFAERPLKGVTLSRVAAQKNPDLWVQAVALASKRYPELQFEWWGPVDADGDIQRLVDIHSLHSSPGRFAGSTDEPGGVLTDSDFLFHPSDSEAHSISIIEAAALGIPIVCSSSVAETLDDTVSAVVFQLGDPVAAASAISRVVEDWPTLSRMAQQLAPAVRRTFSMEACADSYLMVIARCLKSRPGRRA